MSKSPQGGVLHVVEAWGGGVTSAVLDYVRATPHLQHHLLAAEREQHNTGADAETLRHFRSVTAWSRRPSSAWLELRAAVAMTAPDVVHAHSSIAGLVARTLPGLKRDRIVYTPHCYAFERTDLGRTARAGAQAVELLLSPRTAAVAACSPREAELAAGLRRMRHRMPTLVTHVPNVAPESLGSSRAADRPSFLVVGAGRLNKQKDPLFFAAVKASAERRGHRFLWRWLGGNPAGMEVRLRETGIDVTGWISRQRLLTEMATADVYLHTAAWEGAPVTLLEAAGLGVPIVARRIPALASLGLMALGDSPDEVADLLIELREGRLTAMTTRQNEMLTEAHSVEAQGAALSAVYQRVVTSI